MGQLLIAHDESIDGLTGLTRGITVSGNYASRVFWVSYGASASLLGLTIADGHERYDEGGGIYNDEGCTLTLAYCTVTGNTAGNNGGAILNRGNLTLADCTVNGNAADNGGGIYNYEGSTLRLLYCTVTVNTAGYNGGGIFNRGNLGLGDCTVNGNAADNGGGIFQAEASGTNIPFLGLLYCTVAGNTANGSASAAGGIYNSGSTLAALANTIIARNLRGGVEVDVSGDFISAGHNLVGATDGSSGWVDSDLTGTTALPLDPRLGLLQDNGGPTQTMALLPGSPALAAGDILTGTDIATDQRGRPRFRNGTVDIGAFEWQNLTVTNTNDSGPGSLRQAVSAAGPAERVLFAGNLSGQTITLTSGAISILNNDVTIDGAAIGVTISAGGSSRVFEVHSGVSLALSNVTIGGGSADRGAGILDDGTLTHTGCTLAQHGRSGRRRRPPRCWDWEGYRYQFHLHRQLGDQLRRGRRHQKRRHPEARQ